ncbi:60S ribosomal protein L27, putative [Plasmodium berghei]|uniref:60S ribosomal protein L27, putative n=2 Tax=Plasmodium berghei TaxID=5821 RepID=A0A509APY8_PLABA|nr:60S ribosomal protein L27, putative [Plasmodium berghei ANKA]CXI94147.1 60S ribosomal protein L27, putative [Plasmodium berghei]SCL96959.1 60S ribosomal protein L27, putative [Plasmodium berghei]SCM16519.1 60S ribosomal protein L27, putative [Plasmodium berghei]SCM18313.1 60S ribosomal protein L27, putative [Plasmodium berghei]SCN27743.1 60S ribosomal protein L27, putative [Plasmodium berghei]|eukprot:XP_034423396.1 60S ribosomal protein L27, putative [Plasmodium berghei ANKA]
MGKLLKPGKVVIMLNGRRAGKKAIIINTYEGQTRERPYSYCLVAGIEKHPLRVTKKMSKGKIIKRSKVKAFVKYINVNHILPTRYQVANDFDIKSLASDDILRSKNKKKEIKKLGRVFRDKFLDPINKKTGEVSKDVSFLHKKLYF